MKIFRSHLYRKGFTALELLIVLIIIIILVALALASLDLSRRRARDNQRVAQLQALTLAVQSYYDVCREYPILLQASVNNGCPANVTFETIVPDIATLAPFGNVTNQTPFQPSQILYRGFNTQQPGSRCSSYHIGIVLESDNHIGLDKKVGFNSTSGSMYSCVSGGGGISLGAFGFDGTADPRILDYHY